MEWCEKCLFFFALKAYYNICIIFWRKLLKNITIYDFFIFLKFFGLIFVVTVWAFAFFRSVDFVFFKNFSCINIWFSVMILQYVNFFSKIFWWNEK